MFSIISLIISLIVVSIIIIDNVILRAADE